MIAMLLYWYGTVSMNYAGVVQRWIDIGVWSALENEPQRWVGL